MAKNRNWDIDGQMDIFSYMATMPTKQQIEDAKNVLAEPVSFQEKKEKILQSAEEYLKREERLSTLAKERYGEMIKLLSFSEIEEKLFNLKLSGYSIDGQIVPKIATHIIRPLLKGLTSFDENDNSLKIIKSLVDYNIEIRQANLHGELAYMDRCGATARLRRKSDKILKLTLKEEGYRDLEVYGLQLNAHTGRNKSVLFKDYSMSGDIAEILAWLVCFTQYNRAMKNDDLIPEIEESLRDFKNGLKDPLVILKEVVVRATCYTQWSQDYENIRVLYEGRKTFFSIPLQKRRQPSEAALSEFAKIMGLDEDEIRRDINNSYSSVSDRNRLEISEKGIPFTYVLDQKLDFALMCIDPVGWTRRAGQKLVYNKFLPPYDQLEGYEKENNPDYWPFTWPQPGRNLIGGVMGAATCAIQSVLECVFRNYKEKVETLEYLRETKSRAKVYQTKKNIPDKIVKIMQESELNNYFGYVELDESVDTERLKAISDEFIAFKEMYLNKVDTKNIQIRFRLLGNHRAAGLYFPHIGCLCVDVRHPDSLVHEYGHCIDFTVGEKGKTLSEGADFYRCFSAYRDAFLSEIAVSDKAKDNLKGKYNKAYYLKRTEVFARCLEMYVMRTLGMRNSICKIDENTDFAYPSSQRLMDAINSYYSRLFASLHDGNTEAAA